VLNGHVPGWSVWQAFGHRESMTNATAGEDLWPGTAAIVPTPGTEFIRVKSSSADDAAAGTGVQQVRMHWIDSDYDQQTTTLDLNGTSAVLFVASADCRFINDLYATQVGSDGVAAGDIIAYKATDATEIYSMIAAGGNKASLPHRMVPDGYQLLPMAWHAEESAGKRVRTRIRSTDMDGTLLSGVFCFKDEAYIAGDATSDLPLSFVAPSRSIVKVSGWGRQAGAEASCGWWGYLVDKTYI